MLRLARILFFAATSVALGLAVQEHGTLPERVATHFGGDGQPNGWMSRDSHTAGQVGITFFMAALFLGLAVALPRLPDRFINLPHRDHWLAPQRRSGTLAWLSAMLLWLGILLQGFLAFVFREVWRANSAASPTLQLNSLWLQISLFILTAGLVITLLVRFRQPDVERRSGR